MSNQIVAVDLEVIHQEIAVMESRIAELKAFAKMVSDYAVRNEGSKAAIGKGMLVMPADLSLANDPAIDSDLSPDSAQLWGVDIEGLPVGDAAEIVLKRVGRPLRIADFVEVFDGLGYGRSYANLKNTLFTAMDRKGDVFSKVDRGLWGLTAWNDIPDEEIEEPGDHH